MRRPHRVSMSWVASSDGVWCLTSDLGIERRVLAVFIRVGSCAGHLVCDCLTRKWRYVALGRVLIVYLCPLLKTTPTISAVAPQDCRPRMTRCFQVGGATQDMSHDWQQGSQSAGSRRASLGVMQSVVAWRQGGPTCEQPSSPGATVGQPHLYKVYGPHRRTQSHGSEFHTEEREWSEWQNTFFCTCTRRQRCDEPPQGRFMTGTTLWRSALCLNCSSTLTIQNDASAHAHAHALCAHGHRHKRMQHKLLCSGPGHVVVLRPSPQVSACWASLGAGGAQRARELPWTAADAFRRACGCLAQDVAAIRFGAADAPHIGL